MIAAQMNEETYTRRRFLAAGSMAAGSMAALALPALAPPAFALQASAQPARGGPLAVSPASGPEIGLQLFSVDAEMQTDPGGTLRSIREIGYRLVEPVGFYGRSARELRRMLDAAGLRCVSIHVRPQASSPGAPSLASDADTDAVLESCRELGVRCLVCPGVRWPQHVEEAMRGREVTMASVVAAFGKFTAGDWRECAAWLNRLGARAHRFGIRLLYHNGNVEFVRSGDSTGFARLVRETRPNLVQFELDCGWVASAGADPISLLRELKGRVGMVHVKDMLATPANHAMQLNPAELGRGIVDWPALVAAVRAAGVRFAFVEQEAPYARPPLESARANFEFLRAHGYT
jgi:sugar phosphate isomerase/epimerase